MTKYPKSNLFSNLILLILFLCFSFGCEDSTLKRPQYDSPPASSSQLTPEERTFIREIAREFADEFRQELALNGPSIPEGNVTRNLPVQSGLVDSAGFPHPLLAHCTEPVMEFYLQSKDAFQIHRMEDLPGNLVWEDGANEEEFSSPLAKRGGVWSTYVSDFPRTLRTIGPDANGGFRGYLLDYNSLGLVMPHPNSDGYYPGLAKRWAVGPDGRTVYFQLDPNARYSDGKPVRASDYFFTFYFMRNKHIQAPWYNDFYGEDKFESIALFDERTLAITYHKAKPDLVERVSIRPIPEHFYRELDGQFLTKYQWTPEPTTGPYVVRSEDVVKGKSIALSRLNDWWADKKRFYRKRFNPDRIKVQVIRDPNKAFEVFLKGELDMFGLSKTDYWYEKLPDTAPLVTQGYLTKLTFFNQIPPPSYALRINSSKPPMDDLNIRVGFHHAMNFDLVLKKIFRGDFERMRTVADGFGGRSHPSLRAREFSVDLALKSFALAGYRKRGKDGILLNDMGEPLSVEVLTGYKHFEDVLVVLREEAKKAGLDLKLKILESTAAWKTASEKNHQVVFSAFNSFVELFPRFWEPFHSDNAYSPLGNAKYNPDGSLNNEVVVRTSTNNFTQLANREIDQLIDKYREEESLTEITRMAHQLSEAIHQQAVYVPGWKKPWLRMGHWNWVKFPEDWGPKEARDYEEFHLFWIEEEKREQIKQAQGKGEKFESGPCVRVYDKHRSAL